MAALRVDANIILRYLTDAPPEQAEWVARLFAAVAARTVEIIVEEVVLAEVVWTLSSYYRMPRQEIAAALLAFLAEDSILSRDKEELQTALVLFQQRNLDFVDALLAAKTLGSSERELYSFDRDFDRIPGLLRREPA